MFDIRRLLRIRIIKNWSSLVFAMIVTSLSSFLCFLILGKKMTVEDYGLFNSLLALASAVAVFVNNILAGIIANREIALNKHISGTILKKFLPVRILAFIVGSIVVILYVGIKEEVSILIYVSTVLMLSFDSFWDLFEQIAFGLKVTIYSMIINIVSSVVWLVIVFILPLQWSSIGIIIFIYSIICVMKIIVYGICDLRITSCYHEKDSLGYKYYLCSSMPYMYNRILGIISTQVPILLLDGYSGLSETAYYSVGEKFTTPLIKLVMVTISAVFPFLTEALKRNREETKQLVVYVFQLLITVGAFCALLLSTTTDIWLIGILGEKYVDAVEAFNYQIWFAVIICVDSFFSMLLSSDFRQKTLSKVTTIDAMLLLPFLYVGIYYGAKGLSFAKLIHAAICLLYHLFLTNKYYGVTAGNQREINLIGSWMIFFIIAICGILISNKIILIFICFAYMIVLYFVNKNAIMTIARFIKTKYVT